MLLLDNETISSPIFLVRIAKLPLGRLFTAHLCIKSDISFSEILTSSIISELNNMSSNKAAFDKLLIFNERKKKKYTIIQTIIG